MNSGPAKLLAALPAMLSEYRKLSKPMTGTTTIYYRSLTCVGVFLRISREKSVKSVRFLKIYIKVYLMHKTNHA